MKNANDMTDGFQLINIDDFTFSASCEIGVESKVGVFPTCHT